MSYLWERGRWVTPGLRAELVKDTAVQSCRAQGPARVSKRYKLLDAHSQAGMPDKLSVQVVSHLYVRRPGGSHTWTGNAEHNDLSLLRCRILKSACCIWAGSG